MSLRVAPSPTGYFHIGTARTAYHNWLVAKATGQDFILRIDDTDLARNDQAHIQMIYDCMDWLGLDYSTTFRQSDRLDTYLDYARFLVAIDSATEADNGAIIFKLDDAELLHHFDDTIAGKIDTKDDDIANIRNLVLIKADGTPTYNFCSIVDDYLFKVSRIIRGVDHIKNTIKQLQVIDAVQSLDNPANYWMPQFTHVGLIHDMSNKKLSKRTGAKSVLDFKNDGIKPGALLNILLRLGWAPTDAQFDSKHKIVTKDMAIDMILTQGNFKSSSSKFDPVKLDWYNKRY